jgi:putative flavoprotein involved in K+ transport
LRELDLRQANVSTVIWSTGFRGDFSWIHLPILDDQDKPIHKRGVSPERGLYFVGFPWLNSRKSGILYGIGEDAQYIAHAIQEQLA